ncbi:hypothetical protein J2853_007380 [Streptosporangium lutulentum]|uniref:Uncharacterized protein n=1 Tax=Streptosporangium lutulentum TaxID=1461250 RepID=A0ABT9QQJ3_9ACTN|nr:hypothetical protein [Streptosporangium lutulentum]
MVLIPVMCPGFLESMGCPEFRRKVLDLLKTGQGDH